MDKEEMEQFKSAYEAFYIERFIYSSAEVETFESEEAQKSTKQNLLAAYTYLLEETDKITLGDIKNVGNMVNHDSNLASGFRRIGVTAGNKSDFVPAEPNRIIALLNELLYYYYNIWDDLDVFLKEAMFHIRYMRIHPFEDGNKRSGKLILTTNLCKQGYPPIIITKEDTDEYYEFINNCDYDGFADFLRQRSRLEDNTMCGFYRAINGIPFYAPLKSTNIRKLLKPIKKEKNE